MGMGTIDKICCNCIHYLHGQLDNPCAKGVSSVGYLNEGCWRWKSKNGESIEMPTKKCGICGEVLTIDNFYKKKKTPDGLSFACKKCRSWKEARNTKKED